MDTQDITSATDSQSHAKIDGRRAPQWALKPFRDHCEYVERLNQLVHLSMHGISMIRATPQMIEALMAVENSDGVTDVSSTRAQRLTVAKEAAELSQREVDEGFPVLFAQATVALWGSMESAIRVFVARWLENNQEAMKVDAIKKLRVKIGEYEGLSGEDRYFYILDQLEREVSAGLRAGVTRFETLLEPFKLHGAIEEDLRRDIFEMQQVRNIIMHRGSIADRRFRDSCPWLGFSAGDRVVVRHDAYHRYVRASDSYTAKLIVRIGAYFGVDMSYLDCSYVTHAVETVNLKLDREKPTPK